AGAADAEHLALLRELRLRSHLCVQLVARGRILGALTLLTAESGRRYTPGALAFAQDLADRAAQAIDNARLYREATEAAERKNETLALLDTLLASAPIGLGFVDTRLRYVR